MFHACSDGNLEKVKLLVSSGIKYYRAIVNAAKRGHLKVVRFLLENGYYATEEDNSSICGATWHGHVEVVKLLLEYGADPKAQYNRPLKSACFNGHIELVEILLDAGADDLDFLTWDFRINREIKDMLIKWKYRVDGPEYQRMRALKN